MLLKNLLAAAPTLPKSLASEVIIIGGGSGGLACAQAVSKLVESCILLDFVRPSDTYQQTSWGLGGTCVNVGCVPKKLFHRAGALGQCLQSGEFYQYGFDAKPNAVAADWTRLRGMVQNHVKMLNFTYRTSLPSNCQYIHGQAKFSKNGTIMVNDTTTLMAKRAVVIAVGGRPYLPPSLPGARELGITSDDLFSLPTSPGKTLVVGSSYIGLETASFLAGIGLDTTLLVRSQPLRGIPGFDLQSAEKIVSLMRDVGGVKVLRNTELLALEGRPGEITAKLGREQDANAWTEQFNTVLFATGRRPELAHLGQLPNAIQVDAHSHKIRVDPQTFLAAKAEVGTAALYAIGDCAETGSAELTPVAIRQGELVAKHIAGQALDAKLLESLRFVPSTVFALPSEYSRAGLSEQEAIAKYGQDDVEVYLREWEPLETGAAHVNAETEEVRAHVKLVCVKSQNERVVGLHLITPTSSEVIHALALSMALGATKSDFDTRVLGIHPTDGEALCDVTVTKASQQPFKVASGCGGGKCG